MRKDLKILVVNDDGINSPGIAKLAHSALAFGRVWVVAPSEQCSGMSQKLTIFRQLEVREIDYPVPVEKAYSVGGTPVDCVKSAVTYLMDEKPDVVFSGLNNGYNTGFDTCYSGTVGAAMEALINGIPAIAFSAQGETDYRVVDEYLKQITDELLEKQLDVGEMWNVNFPCCPPEKLRGILRDRKPAPLCLYSNYYVEAMKDTERSMIYPEMRITPVGEIPEGTDAHAVLSNYISIGKLRCMIF